MRVPLLTTAAAALLFSFAPLNKVSGQKNIKPTAKDTLDYITTIMPYATNALVKNIYASRQQRTQFVNQNSPNAMTQTAQIMTRPIKITVETTGNPSIDKAFKKYARDVEKQFNAAVETHPDTIANVLKRHTKDTLALAYQWFNFTNKPYEFATEGQPETIGKQHSKGIGNVMLNNRQLYSFQWRIPAFTPKDPLFKKAQEIILTPIGPGSSWQWDEEGNNKAWKSKNKRT